MDKDMTLKEAWVRDKILKIAHNNSTEYEKISYIVNSAYNDGIYHSLMKEGMIEVYNRIPHTTPKGYIVIKNGGFIVKELWKVVTGVSAVIAAVASVVSLILQFCRNNV